VAHRRRAGSESEIITERITAAGWTARILAFTAILCFVRLPSRLKVFAHRHIISGTGTNSAAQISALSSRITQNLTPQPGQQTIQDIQTDMATAQTTIQDAGARQAQSQSMLQNIVDTTETVSTDQVASEILALQNSLQASYQTTSMLSQLTLTKYLPVG